MRSGCRRRTVSTAKKTPDMGALKPAATPAARWRLSFNFGSNSSKRFLLPCGLSPQGSVAAKLHHRGMEYNRGDGFVLKRPEATQQGQTRRSTWEGTA